MLALILYNKSMAVLETNVTKCKTTLPPKEEDLLSRLRVRDRVQSSDSDSDAPEALTLAWLGCYKNMRELRNSNGFNLDWLVLIDLYLVTIWLIFEIDQSDSSWAELDQ